MALTPTSTNRYQSSDICSSTAPTNLNVQITTEGVLIADVFSKPLGDDVGKIINANHDLPFKHDVNGSKYKDVVLVNDYLVEDENYHKVSLGTNITAPKIIENATTSSMSTIYYGEHMINNSTTAATAADLTKSTQIVNGSATAARYYRYHFGFKPTGSSGLNVAGRYNVYYHLTGGSYTDITDGVKRLNETQSYLPPEIREWMARWEHVGLENSHKVILAYFSVYNPNSTNLYCHWFSSTLPAYWNNTWNATQITSKSCAEIGPILIGIDDTDIRTCHRTEVIPIFFSTLATTGRVVNSSPCTEIIINDYGDTEVYRTNLPTLATELKIFAPSDIGRVESIELYYADSSWMSA